MILSKLANFIDFRFLHVCVQNILNFVSKIWEMVDEIKTEVDRLLLVSKLKKSSISQNISTNFFSLSSPKVVYLRPFLSSLPFPNFWKQNFMYFAHKHVETGPNFSLEISRFLKFFHAFKDQNAFV